MDQIDLLRGRLQAGLPGLDPRRPLDGPGSGSDSPWPVQIVRCWREASREPTRHGSRQVRPLMRLALSTITIEDDPPDLELRWLGTIAGACYLVLEQGALDEETPVQYVLRLAEPRWVVPLYVDELREVEASLREAVAGHPGLAADAIATHVGEISDLGSPEYYAACLTERGIVGRLRVLSEQVERGTAVPVCGLVRPTPATLGITLSTPTGDGSEYFWVSEHIALEGDDYLVLYAPYRTLLAESAGRGGPRSELRDGLHLVKARVGAVAALDDAAEFERISRLLIDRLEDSRPGNRYRPMGRIRPDDLERLFRLLEPASARPEEIVEAERSSSDLAIAPTFLESPLPPLPPPPPAPQPSPTVGRQCANCGDPGQLTIGICSSCGAPLEGPSWGAGPFCFLGAFGAAPSPEPPPGPQLTSERAPSDACSRCRSVFPATASACPGCGVARVGPACPRCGQPVAVGQGLLSWNEAWKQRCAACLFEFVGRLQLVGAEVDLRGGEWKYVAPYPPDKPVTNPITYTPTVQIRVKRRLPPLQYGGPVVTMEGELTLTVDELRAVLAELEGSLRVLLERKRWVSSLV